MASLASLICNFFYRLFQFAAAGITLVLVLHYTEICTIGYGNPLVWAAADAAALYVLWLLYARRRKVGQGSRRAVPHGTPRSGSRTPYNTHGAKSDKPVWRNIPDRSTLLLDTNVLMCPEPNIRSWFGYLLHHAEKRGWHVVVHGAVYEEIIHHLKSGNADKAGDARLARNRIELLQEKLGKYMEIAEMRIESDSSVHARYADPKLIEYMLTHRHTILFSFDNDLKIRCKQLMRGKQPGNRVFSEEDFYTA